jgi:O-antigen/teichoic acid export membrane protein
LAPAGRRYAFAADGLIQHNLVVAAGTLSAGFLGFAFQALIAHRLAPGDYAAVFAVVTFLTLVGLPASALTLVMAREASQDRAIGHTASSAALLRFGNRALLFLGSAVALILALFSPALGTFLNISTGLILVAAVSIPPTLALPMILGELQGEQRFLALSALSVGQASLKLIGAIGLGIIYGPAGVIGGIAFASLATYLIGLLLVRRKLGIKVGPQWMRPVVPYLALMLISTLALSLLLSADVLLVKHFFAGRQAGVYAAVAALGRAIFWAAAGVAAVLFPKLVFTEGRGNSGSHIVIFSVGLVVLGGAAGLVILSWTSKLVLTVFAGPAYASGAVYLTWYAIGMTLLGCASVLIATHQSRAGRAFLAVLLPTTLAEALLITAFHQSLTQVIVIMDLCLGALVVGLAILLLQRKQDHVSSQASLLARPPVAEARI